MKLNLEMIKHYMIVLSLMANLECIFPKWGFTLYIDIIVKAALGLRSWRGGCHGRSRAPSHWRRRRRRGRGRAPDWRRRRQRRRGRGRRHRVLETTRTEYPFHLCRCVAVARVRHHARPIVGVGAHVGGELEPADVVANLRANADNQEEILSELLSSM